MSSTSYQVQEDRAAQLSEIKLKSKLWQIAYKRWKFHEAQQVVLLIFFNLKMEMSSSSSLTFYV